MSIQAGDVRATLTLDASKFSQGVAQARSELSALSADGQRASNDFASVEGRFAQSATAMAQAMRQAGQGGDELLQLAAKADAAQLKLEAAASKAASAAEALNTAREAARQSGDALTLLKDSAAASAENLAQAKAALDALSASGSATTAQLTGAENAVKEFAREQAALAGQIAQTEATHAANAAAVSKAEAAYQGLSAQVLTAQAGADRAQSAFAKLTNLFGGSGGMATLGRFGDQIAAIGTSTLTSASRSLSSIAASALGIQRGTAANTLAASGMDSVLKKLVSTLGMTKLGLAGVGVSLAWQAYQYVRAAEQAKTGSAKWEKAWEAAQPKDTTIKAILDAQIELDTTGLADDVKSVYEEVGRALTDGEPDTEGVIQKITEKTTGMFSSVRQKIQTWYDLEMAKLDLSTPAGVQKAAELTTTYQGLLDQVERLDSSTAAWVAEYAGQSTEACTQALTQLETYEEELERLARKADEQVALLNSNQRAAYTAVTNGLTSDETTVGNATQYVTVDYSLQLGYAEDDYNAQLAALWQEYQDRLNNAATEQDRMEIDAEYELKLRQADTDYQQQRSDLAAAYQRQLGDLLRGYAAALAKTDPTLRDALDKALAGDFSSVDDLDLSNKALVGTFKTLVEAGALEGVTDADLSTAKGQMRALLALLAQGSAEAVDSAYRNFTLVRNEKNLGDGIRSAVGLPKGGFLDTLLGGRNAIEVDDTAEAVNQWATKIQDAVNAAQTGTESSLERLQTLKSAFYDSLDYGAAAGEAGNGVERLASLFAALNAAADAGNLDASAWAEYSGMVSDVMWILGNLDPSGSAEDLAFLTRLSDALNALGYTTDATTVVSTLAGVAAQCSGLASAAERLDSSRAWQGFPKTIEEFKAGPTQFTWTGFAQSASWESQAEYDAKKVQIPVEPDWTAFAAAVSDWSAGGEAEVRVSPEPDWTAFAAAVSDWSADNAGQSGGASSSGSGGVQIPVEADLSGMPAAAAAFGAQAVREFSGAGSNAGRAFASGIRSQISASAAAGSAIGRAALSALRATLDIHSPSRRMREAGVFSGRGFALGISDEITRAENSIRLLAGRTLSAVGSVTNNNHYHGSPISVQATVRSDEDVRVLANRLARLAAGQNYGLR